VSSTSVFFWGISILYQFLVDIGGENKRLFDLLVINLIDEY
jgi:hypothetical protein